MALVNRPAEPVGLPLPARRMGRMARWSESARSPTLSVVEVEHVPPSIVSLDTKDRLALAGPSSLSSRTTSSPVELVRWVDVVR